MAIQTSNKITFTEHKKITNDVVDFQIYSVDGFEFSDGLKSITLQTVAFRGGNIIDTGCSYKWLYWNGRSGDDGRYEEIRGATNASLIVDFTSPYSLSGLKCVMTYDGLQYEDYVTLTKKSYIYTAVAKFFDGDNMIESDDTNSIIYIELYKDNEKIEGRDPAANEAYNSVENSISGNYINTDITGINGEKKYFVCYDSDKQMYDVVLGQYSTNETKWTLINSKYVYRNTFNNSTRPFIYVPKENVIRALNINFTIYDGDDVIAITSTRVVDLNDPIVSSTPPSNPIKGQMWLDTSTSQNSLKMWDGTKWVSSSYQKGNVIYTSRPTGYSVGDLWILGPGETCRGLTEGGILRANYSTVNLGDFFSEMHWDDVDREATEQKNNIKQYFNFDVDDGLKIGQTDEKFYVNISSTKMGFFDAQDGTAEEVVSISNKSAKIQTAKLKGNTEFYGQINICDPTSNPEDNTDDTLFIFKVEKNGSLSLAIAN